MDIVTNDAFHIPFVFPFGIFEIVDSKKVADLCLESGKVSLQYLANFCPYDAYV